MELQINDLQVKSILYYDPAYANESLSYCKKRNIDCLPSVDDSNTIYVRDNVANKFEPIEIDQLRKVNTSDKVFSRELLDKFKNNHLLLVYDEKELTGVVHFSDYNSIKINEYLYSLFFNYENLLRRFLVLNNLADKDMYEYYCRKYDTTKRDIHKIKMESYNEEKAKRLPAFQTWYLKDLFTLINHKKLIKLTDLGELRNIIMHARELVEKDDYSLGDLVYNIDSFSNFFEMVLTLKNDFKRVANKIRFLEST